MMTLTNQTVRIAGHYVLDFQEIDQTQIAAVGGKGAHLEGLPFPTI